ncbi:hypothetical protein CERSUDRAFT_86129 [Gelatoporia subvermispora B]|uniref:Uncharacterized protein n=1 Tax=Ceriporiopsis subvermispora (strain B) TaxID=914234 RepID=M2R7N5_CERS8|nr:hypothetical protein CERSUDRAFT_86129 [Gelatoporia subvermispora B]
MIRLIRKAASVRADCVKAKQNIKKFDKILALREVQGGEANVKYAAAKAESEAACSTKEKEFQKLLFRLTEQSQWPMQASTVSAPDTLSDLVAPVDILRAALEEVKELAPGLDAWEARVSAEEEAVLVRQNQASKDPQDAREDMDADARQSNDDLAVHQSELVEVVEMFSAIERRVDEVYEEVLQHKADIEDAIWSMIAEGLEHLDLEAEHRRHTRGHAEATLEVKIQRTQEDLQRTAKDIDGLLDLVHQGSVAFSEKNEENVALRLENMSLQDEVSTLRACLDSLETRSGSSKIGQFESNVATLSSDMMALLSPEPPPPITMNTVAQRSFEIASTQLHTHVDCLMEELKSQVAQTLDRHTDGLRGNVVDRLQKTMEIMEDIRNWAVRAGVKFSEPPPAQVRPDASAVAH